MPSTGLVYDSCYLDHNTGEGAMSAPPYEGLAYQTPHPECPQRIANVKSLLDYTGLTEHLQMIAPTEPDRKWVELVHSKEHIDRIYEICANGGGRYDEYTPMGPSSYNIALQAAEGCTLAINRIFSGDITCAYALIRPPGHHATRNQAMGFCLFNNMAVAAAYAKAEYSLSRILILDWDVHHGNGTQSIFYGDDSVLFISIHQANNYPEDSGTIKEDGTGKGRGYTINIPLPAGTGDKGYLHAMNEIVMPVCHQFEPELILVSAGQDAAYYDPFGRNSVTYSGFAEMTAIVRKLAERYCSGNLLMIQEGGYNIVYQAFSVLSIIEILCEKNAGIAKPWDHDVPNEPMLYEKEIALVREHHNSFWDF